MPTHSSQIGSVLQNGFVFLGGTFHRWVYVPNNFTKLFCFSEKWKTFAFQSILLNGFLKYFWIWPEIGFGFTKWLWYFSKNNEYICKMVCSFFGKMHENATSLVQKWLSLTEWVIKFLEIWRYLKLFLQNGL